MSVQVFPDEQSWLAARKQGLGASEVAAVIGANKHKSALAVYTSKVDSQSERETSRMRAGKAFERAIAMYWAEERGYELALPADFACNQAPPLNLSDTRVAQWSIDGSCLSCTPDVFASDEGGFYVVECKRVTPALRRVPNENGGWKEGPPLHYIVQVQAQLMVLEACGVQLEHGILVADFGGDDVPEYEIHKDPALWASMRPKLELFWANHVLAKVVPAPDKYTDSEDLSHAYRTCTGGLTAEIPPHIVKALRDARTLKRVHESAIDTAETNFKAAMKDAEFGYCGGVLVATWKNQVQNRQAQPAKTVQSRPFKFSDDKAAAI